MRVERTDHPQFQTCWLTTDEYEQLRRTTNSYREELIVRLGGEVGLRSFEVSQITAEHPRREVIENDDYHFLRVPEGKDTTGNGGNPAMPTFLGASSATCIATSAPRPSATRSRLST